MAKYYLHLTQEESWDKVKELINELHKKANLKLCLQDILRLVDDCKTNPFAQYPQHPSGLPVREEAYRIAKSIWPSSLDGNTDEEKARSLLSSLIIMCMPTNGGRPGLSDCHFALAERLGIETGVRLKLHPSEILYEIKRNLPTTKGGWGDNDISTTIFMKYRDALLDYYPSAPIDTGKPTK